MPLHYFETTSPGDWRIKDIFEAIQKKYPDKERSYHGLATKKELENLKTHPKQSFRERAQSLLEDFKIPPSDQESITSSIQLANTIVNKAQTINQATHQTIQQNVSENSVHPRKRLRSELENVPVSSNDCEDDDLDDLFPSATDQDDKDDDSM